MSPQARGRAGEGHNGLRIDLLAGGRYVAPPQNAVHKGYDALPSRSAKFNTKWDNPLASTPIGLAMMVDRANRISPVDLKKPRPE